MKLYRPVGFKELDLILNSGSRRFPSRLPTQPFFYPVLNSRYAAEIAEKWNTKDVNSGYVGYITKFEIDDVYISNFEPHIVGSSIHQEFWIPAEELEEFNKNINHNILIENAYYGLEYKGISTISTLLKDKNFIEQLMDLSKLAINNIMDFTYEVLGQWKIINQNFIIWERDDFTSSHIAEIDKEQLLQKMKQILKKHRKWFIEE